MRLTIFICLLTLALGCNTTKNSKMILNKLNGEWKPVKQEMGGNLMPTSFFENQKLTIIDSTYTLVAESIDKGVVKYKDDKMDIYGKEGVNKGKHFTAIYKYENEELTICYNLAGNGYPESFETKGKPLFFLSIFRKEPAK